jgi:CheY-like chemotaxis protein
MLAHAGESSYILFNLDRRPGARQHTFRTKVADSEGAMDTTQTDRLTILIVDDNDAVRRVLTLVLETSGFQVMTASSGAAAVEAYRRRPPDVVVLDVQMPGQDGRQTFAALRQLDPKARVVFLSGDTGKYTVAELMALGAARVLHKPPDLAELEQVLCGLVGRRPPQRPPVAATRARRPAANRRVAVRHHPMVGTLCRVDAPSGLQPHLGLVWNLSSSGLSMVLHEPVPAETSLQAELKTADRSGSLPITLQVVHVHPIGTGDFYLGAQFDRPLDPDELHPFLIAGSPPA